MMEAALQPASLGGILLRSRIIRSATHEGMADDDGCPLERLKRLYVRLARGGAGAIITGYAGVQQNGKSPLYRMLMIDQDRFVGPFKAITDAVHESGTPIILQIAHCGRQTLSRITGFPTVAPSAIRDGFYNEETPRELKEGEIDETVDNFVKAIERAKGAGFDGTQLHAAHGYLLSQFLSPYTNRRHDRWGGTTENRFRIIREIYDRARRVVGDYPIWVKLNAYDGRRGGMRVEEAVRLARLLEQSGCAAIEVSSGTFEDGSREAKPPNFNVEAAQAIRAGVSIPVIVVGGIASLVDIVEIVGRGKADAVSMCRPFIIEPDIVRKLQEGRQERSRCIQCNLCGIGARERPLRCYYGKLKGQGKDDGEAMNPQPSGQEKARGQKSPMLPKDSPTEG